MTNNYTNAVKMSITIDKEVARELESTALELNDKKSRIIQKALMFYFDYLDEKIADKRLDELKTGKTHTVSAEEAYKLLEL